MKLNLDQVRKFAGLPLMEAEKEDKVHEAKEQATFKKACGCMEDVIKMCDQRLSQELSPEHKKQYEDLRACAKHCCEVMQKHLESYK